MDSIGRLCFLIMCQFLLVFFLAWEQLTDDEMVLAYAVVPKNNTIVLSRFLCAIFLHISLADELIQGFSIMKFSLNHRWLFRSWVPPFFIGFAQMLVIFLVEGINLMLLITNNTHMDILMNFLALVIISDFDDYFFMTVKKQEIGKLITDGSLPLGGDEPDISLEDILRVRITSSSNARHEVARNLVEEGRPPPREAAPRDQNAII